MTPTADSTATRNEFFIGLDLGTSGLKAVALDAAGRVAARAHAEYATARPEPGAALQSPDDWWAAVESVVAELRAAVPTTRWAAVGLSAMIPTLVLADDDGHPVGPATTWEDARAGSDGEALRAAVGAEALYDATGQWVDGRYLLPMWLRQERTAPGVAAGAAYLLGAKDWLFWRLVGEPLTDPSTATGFGCYALGAGAWHRDVTAAATAIVRRAANGHAGDAGVTLPALPPILPSATARPLTAGAAARLGLPAGLPVCLGAADSVLGALGLGAHGPGDVAYIAGTSTVLLGVCARPVVDREHRYLVTPLAGVDGFGFEMDLLATGSAVRWLSGLLGYGPGGERRVMELAASLEPGAAGVSFLPYLAPGEQGALWDPALAGTVTGLDLTHGPAHLARALVDGIVLESRRCLAVLGDAGLPAGNVFVGGGSGTDPAFLQQLADAGGRTVVLSVGETDFSARGAAVLAAVAVGREVAAPGSAMDAPAVVRAPDAGRASVWQHLWERHERALAAARDLYHGA